MKAAMLSKGYIDKELAPSYFLECLMYNSSNENFRENNLSEIIVNIINQFYRDNKDGSISNYVVQNEQRKLFGTGEQQWNLNSASHFISQLIKFWSEYNCLEIN